MSKAIAQIAIGGALIAVSFLVPGVGLALAFSGGGLVLGGIGTLLTKQMTGLSANVRNPIQPRNVIYGQALIGGTSVFLLETGESDKYLHTVYVLACHPCQSIDAILFDGRRIPLDGDGNSISFQDSTDVIGSQQTVDIASITRVGDVVTVVMTGAMPLPAATIVSAPLVTGDTVGITGVSTDATLNGSYQITLVNDTTFTYVSGGTAVSITGEGIVRTTWPDYGDTIHAEFASGTQTSNPFPGLAAGDDTGSNGLWTSAHALRGHCAVYLRLKYGGETYASGMPVISFVVSGKNDIYDPRTGGTGYTTNAALCIADFLAHPTWGFNAAYTSEIPIGPLMAAANICDEGVALAAGGTEPRYTCSGSFQLSAKRSEILQNLLTACGGRLTYVGGQFFINPAAWIGTSVMMGGTALMNDAGSEATSGTLTVWSEFIDTASGGIASAGISFGRLEAGDPWGISGTGTIVRTNTPYGLRSNSVTLSADNLLTNLSVNCFIFPDLATPPGGFATYSPAPNLRIYDVYIDAHFADGSDSRLRPSLHGVINLAGGNPQFGSFTDPELALDTDTTPPVTYANYVRPFFNQNYFSNSPPNVLTYSMFGAISVTAEPVTTALTFAAGPFKWQPKLATRDLYNGIRATYISPANNWQSTDMPPYAQDELHGYESDANLAADGGERRFKDIQLPFTKSVATAQRLAKIELLRSRQQGTGTFAYNVAMYQVTVLDVIAMDLPYLGWTAKLLEVTAHRFIVNRGEGAGAILGTEIDVQETDPSIYDWSDTEELAAGGNAQTVVGPSTVAAPSGATATSDSSTAANVGGVDQSRILIGWNPATDGYVINGGSVIVQYQIVGDTAWTGLGTFDSSTTSAYITGVSDGDAYMVRLAYLSVQGIQSPWTVIGPVTAGGGGLGLRDVWNEVPTGASNAVNTVFALSHVPSPALSLHLYRNGDLLRQGAGKDFTLDGNVITFLIAPPNEATHGDWLRASYKYSGTGATTGGTAGDGTPVTSGGSVGSGTGGSVSSSTAAQIAADMQGLNEAHPNGVPTSYSFYTGPYLSMGNNPDGSTALEFWGALYVAEGGSLATNTRVAVRNMRVLWLRASTGQWQNNVVYDSAEVGFYTEPYTTNLGLDTDVRTESDGSMSFKTEAGKVAHFYTPFPRVSIDPNDLAGVVSVAEAQLVLDDPAGTDDRASADFVLDIGADYYPATTGSGIENNPGVAGGKYKLVTTSWRSFAMSTVSQSQLEAHPLPFNLSGVLG